MKGADGAESFELVVAYISGVITPTTKIRKFGWPLSGRRPEHFQGNTSTERTNKEAHTANTCFIHKAQQFVAILQHQILRHPYNKRHLTGMGTGTSYTSSRKHRKQEESSEDGILFGIVHRIFIFSK